MKIKKENVESAARALAAMPDGRCFLQWLLARCDVRGPVFTGDLESVCKREALRQLGRPQSRYRYRGRCFLADGVANVGACRSIFKHKTLRAFARMEHAFSATQRRGAHYGNGTDGE